MAWVFTVDGRHLITGSGDYTIKLWDLDTGREVRRLEGHSGTVYAVALSADGKRLLSGSLDGTARLWDMDTGNETALFDSRSGPIYAVAFAADGTILTGGYDRTIRDWPAGGGDAVALFPGAPE
jgi:WD40 repeat protein